MARKPTLQAVPRRAISVMMAQSLTSAPQIFDRALLRRRLTRALASGAEDFLLPRAAVDLVDRLAPVQRAFRTVLDLGTPRPVLAAELAAALPGASITRAAPGPEPADPRWRTLVADGEAQPFGPERFDLAVSVLALHGFNDLPGTLVQVRRALKPDGFFLGAMLGGQTLTELRAVLTEAEVELTGGASPRVAPFSDLRDLGSLLQRAGLALPVTDTEVLTVRYGSVFGLFADLRAMGATNALQARSRAPLSRRVLGRAAALYAERFGDTDGRLRATFELVWLSGWAPDPSQQKPLKPGSAKVRLADALKGIAVERGE